MNFKQQIIQAVGELIVPVLGFYYWNWDLNFIFLFYFIDLLAFQCFTHLKWRKIVAYRGVRHGNILIFHGLIFVISLASIIAIETALTFVYPKLNLWDSLVDFLFYVEWGIPQIILLVPLVLFANFQQYKMEFLMPGKFRIVTELRLKKNTLFSIAILLVASALFLLLTWLGLHQSEIWLWVILLAKLLFDLFKLNLLKEI